MTCLWHRLYARTAIGCSIAITSGYSYLYFANHVIQKVSLALFCLSMCLILPQIAFFVHRMCRAVWIARKAKTVAWEEFPELKQLVKEMNVQLNKKNPFEKVKGLNA